jgi:hypothetical protein
MSSNTRFLPIALDTTQRIKKQGIHFHYVAYFHCINTGLLTIFLKSSKN